MTGPALILDPLGLPPAGVPVAVGVSGGADSLALLHALWQSGRPVHAYTVDHGYREASAAEAEAVAAWCLSRKISHRILTWRGEKPQSGRQAAARKARYRLLCQACNEAGINHLVTAHTADDQAETVFMRLRRGSGKGLAAMPHGRRIAAGAGKPITLGRPMLALRRGVVRAYAEAHDLPIQDDPSNEDPAYERIRTRALLAALEAQDLMTVDALCRLALERAQENAGIIADMHFLKDEALSIDPMGLATVAREEVHRHGPSALTGAFLERVLFAVGGAEMATTCPDLPAQGQKTTAGGVLFAGEEEVVQLFREPSALLGRADGAGGFTPQHVAPRASYLFDQRFIVTTPQDIPAETYLRPLGQMIPQDIATSTLARQRVATLPCLATAEGVTHLPKMAETAIFKAFSGWQAREAYLSVPLETFDASSLFAERFTGDVIRY